MQMLHYTKDDRAPDFHLFGYFKEFSDKKTRQYLGHQLLEEIDSDTEMGYSRFTYETYTQNLRLKCGFKNKVVEASKDKPLEVEVFYHFACGRAKK
jgi:hypothetical protein